MGWKGLVIDVIGIIFSSHIGCSENKNVFKVVFILVLEVCSYHFYRCLWIFAQVLLLLLLCCEEVEFFIRVKTFVLLELLIS
jgi:hypothetical protein